MAGQPINVEHRTSAEFDGSPAIAMKVDLSFGRLPFWELGTRADRLDAHLREAFPGDRQ